MMAKQRRMEPEEHRRQTKLPDQLRAESKAITSAEISCVMFAPGARSASTLIPRPRRATRPPHYSKTPSSFAMTFRIGTTVHAGSIVDSFIVVKKKKKNSKDRVICRRIFVTKPSPKALRRIYPLCMAPDPFAKISSRETVGEDACADSDI